MEKFILHESEEYRFEFVNKVTSSQLRHKEITV